MRIPLLLRRAPAAALALAVAACGARLAPAPPAAVVNRPVEIAVSGDVLGPSAVAVHADVLTPSGARLDVPAFDRGAGAAFRFRPREPGLHTWRVLAGNGIVDREVARGEVRVEETGVPGGIRRDGARLVDDAGRTFHPLGENRFNVYDPTWSDGLSIDAYVARMAEDGMNTLRIFAIMGCGGGPPRDPEPGCLEPGLGRFDETVAARYDAIFAAAERHGLRVVLGVFAIGFTPGDAWKGWEANPYSAARGGPARTPRDFFTDAKAREAERRRLRYVAARWGASPALLSVDLLNEPEWDGPIPESAWMPWAEEMARTWRALDPYGHPVTAGPVGLHANVERDERPWWESGGCDVVQWHRYGADVYDVHALARALVDTVRDTARYGKPVLLGEFGWGGDPAPLWDHTHVGIWASTFAGAGVLSHSAPVFQIDSDAPMTPERARHFRTLAAFLRRAEAGGDALAPAADPVASIPGTRALALAGGGTTALWIHGPRDGYGAPVRGLRLSVPGLAAGRWRVSWVDDVTGAELRAETVEARGGATSLEVPPFVRHVAALAVRLPPAATPVRTAAMVPSAVR